MAPSIRTILPTAFLLVPGVAGQQANHYVKPGFVYPPDGSSNIYNMLDTVIVTYNSNFDTPDLYTFCQPEATKQIYQQRAPGFNASVHVLLNFTSEAPCWFNLRNGTYILDSPNSATFSIIGQERSSGRQVFGPSSASTSPPSSSTSLASSTTSSSTTASVALSSTNTSPAAGTGSASVAAEAGGSNGSSGLSAGVSAGIGVGSGIGLIALAAGALLLWHRHQRRQLAPQKAAAEMEGSGPNNAAAWQQDVELYAAQQQYYVAELNSADAPAGITTPRQMERGVERTHYEMA